MLKSLWIFAFLIFGYSANSQIIIAALLGDKLNSGGIEFGLDGGYGLSNLSGVKSSKATSSFNLGFYFDFAMKNPSWLLSSGVRVKGTMGADRLELYDLGSIDLNNSFAGGSVSRVLGYFQVPISMKYIFKNNFFAQAGIQLGLRNASKDKFVNTFNSKNDLVYTLNVKKAYHPLDGGLLVGIGYRITKGNGMNLSAQYYYGLVDVKVSDTTPKQMNRALYINVGIPIGKGKATKVRAEKEANESIE